MTRDGFRHEALFYATDDEFLDGTTSFIRDALAADEPILVVVEADKMERLRRELGAEAARVRFADMGDVGANPARIIPAWQEFVDEHSGQGRPLRGIGEPIFPGRSPAELVECQLHESLLNVAFDGGSDWSLICPYDADALPRPVLDEARRSHRLVTEGGVRRRSEAYADAVPSGALPEPAAEPAQLPFERADLGLVRRFVRDSAQRAGFASDRMPDLVLAINEIVSNSIRHAPGGGGVARAWRDRDMFVCEVSDRGRIEDPLAGREPLAYDAPGGRGLWLVNHLCDLVQVRSSAAGTVVRLHMQLA